MNEVWAGPVTEFEIGTQKILEIENEYVLVLRSLSGFYAIEDRCSHDDNELFGGLVQDNETGAVITCPRHGAKFDLCSGAALCLPAVKGVRSYAVVVKDDGVWVLSRD